MKVSDVMTAAVEHCGPDDTLQEVAERMRVLDIGPMPVCDGDRVIGIITDRDIVVRAVAKGEDARQCRVRDVMTGNVVYCSPDDDIRDAARLMASHQVRRLVVIDDARRMCGIIALGDLAVEVNDDKLSGRILEHISEPPSSPAM